MLSAHRAQLAPPAVQRHYVGPTTGEGPPPALGMAAPQPALPGLHHRLSAGAPPSLAPPQRALPASSSQSPASSSALGFLLGPRLPPRPSASAFAFSRDRDRKCARPLSARRPLPRSRLGHLARSRGLRGRLFAETPLLLQALALPCPSPPPSGFKLTANQAPSDVGVQSWYLKR